MKDRAKFFVVALFLSLIFSVGAVCAQEDMSFEQSNIVEVPVGTVDVDPDENNEDISLNQEDNEDNDVLKANNEPAVKQRNHTVDGNTFDDIVNVISGAGDGDIIFLGGKNYTGTSQIRIEKSVTIVGGSSMGDGKYSTLNAQSQSRIFYINAKDVSVYGINFINGHSDNDGGAVYWDYDNGNLGNCSFVSNSATRWGGAVWWSNHNGVLSDCSFENNSASDGGAVFWNGASGVLGNCSFVSNSANAGRGGAVRWSGNDGVLSDCSFVSNYAGVNGGAVYWNDNNGNLGNCSFENNSAGYNGGAVLWIGDNGVLGDCSFVSNSAGINGGGGAVWWIGDNGVLGDCSFVSNSAGITGGGGAVWWNGGKGVLGNCSFLIPPVFNVDDNDYYLTLTLKANLDYTETISGNAVKSDLKFWNGSDYVKGNNPNFGILVYPNQNLTLEIYNSEDELADNVSGFTDANGKFVYDYLKLDNGYYTYIAYAAYNQSRVISTGNFMLNIGEFNRLQKVIDRAGENSIINLTRNYTFTNGLDDNLTEGIVIPNNVTVHGNGYTISGNNSARIFNIIGDDVTISGIQFINGNAFNGGAVYWSGVDGSLRSSSFINNSANRLGGAIWMNSGSIENCNFTDNKATGDESRGGAIFFNSNGNVTNCNFTNHNVYLYGGAIYFGKNGDVSYCNFMSNNATHRGGVIFFWLDGNVSNCNFSDNKATQGGAIFFYGSTNAVTNCNFTDNKASEWGGAVYFFYNGIVSNCNFTDNKASDGGAVYFLHNGIVSNCNFTDNKASDWGGVIFFWLDGNVSNCNFTDNKATGDDGCGGAVYFLAGAGEVTNCSFTNNSATKNGGAIYFNKDSNGRIINCNFTNNQASGYGGAVYSISGGNVTNCNFIGNFAQNTGGAMYLVSDDYSPFISDDATSSDAIHGGSAINCTFIDNSATKNGGAIYFGNAMDCKFLNNSANLGGAIFAGDAFNCTFTNNGADYGGGAMYNGNAENCTFTNNSAGYDGGAIFRVSAKNSIFIGNTAQRDGGAINVGNAINCSFVNNTALNGGAIWTRNDTFINCSFTDNSAVCGSALYIAGSTNISDSSIFNNLANSISLELIINLTGNNVTIKSVLTGGDNLLNGIYAESGNVSLMNVSYLGFDGLMNTGDKLVNPVGSADLSDDGALVYMDSREAGQNITIEILRNGIPYYDGTFFSDIYGAVNVAFANLKPGNYTVKTYLRKNSYYTLVNSTGSFFLPKIDDYDMVINSSRGKFSEIVVVSLPEDATGNVTITVGNKTFFKAVENGTATFNITGLDFGKYDANITYSGDDTYVPANRTLSFTFVSVSTVIVAIKEFDVLATDYNAGERGNFIYAGLVDEFGEVLANKTIQIAINGIIYNVLTDDNGLAGIQINLASANTYTCAWFFQGDEMYNASLLASSRIVISKKPIVLSASNCVFKASAKTKTVTAKLTTSSNPHDGKTYLAKNKFVTLTLNGRIYNGRTDENGVVKFNIQVTKKGTYSAVIKFAGDRTYEAASKTIKITLDDKGASNSQKSSVKAEVLTSSDDVSVIPTSNVDKNKNASVIDVAKEFTRMACDYEAGEKGDYFYAVLKDSNGNVLVNKTVQIAVNGPIYNLTSDENGTVGLMVNLASANTYTYALAFSGDKDYNAAALACSKLVVTKKPITITAKDHSFKASAKTKTVTATLSTSKNPYDGKTYLSPKKVTLKVNGKTYIGTCGSNGKVTFNVQLTKKGTYSAVISFDGDKTYESATKTIKIKIN